MFPSTRNSCTRAAPRRLCIHKGLCHHPSNPRSLSTICSTPCQHRDQQPRLWRKLSCKTCRLKWYILIGAAVFVATTAPDKTTPHHRRRPYQRSLRPVLLRPRCARVILVPPSTYLQWGRRRPGLLRFGVFYWAFVYYKYENHEQTTVVSIVSQPPWRAVGASAGSCPAGNLPCRVALLLWSKWGRSACSS